MLMSTLPRRPLEQCPDPTHNQGRYVPCGLPTLPFPTRTGPAVLHRRRWAVRSEQYRLPAVYADRLNGGLICYGPDRVNPFRLAAGYVDRILKGEKAADLPVQAPTRYKLVVNLKTAKALGLTVPPSLLTSADEVIE